MGKQIKDGEVELTLNLRIGLSDDAFPMGMVRNFLCMREKLFIPLNNELISFMCHGWKPLRYLRTSEERNEVEMRGLNE